MFKASPEAQFCAPGHRRSDPYKSQKNLESVPTNRAAGHRGPSGPGKQAESIGASAPQPDEKTIFAFPGKPILAFPEGA
jgi:hypothetical protein